MTRARSPTKSPLRKTRSSCSNSVKKQSKKPLSHVQSQSLEEKDQTCDEFDDPDYDWLSDESQDMDSSVHGPEEDLDVDAGDDTVSAKVPDPKTLKRMPLEEKIRAASKYLHATGSSNMSEACNLFGIKQGKEYARFRRRHQGLNQPPRFAQVKRQRLSPAQELTLVEWCIYLAILGVPLNRTTILPRAQMILDPNDPKNANVKPPGSSWLRRFLRRYRDVLKSGRPGGLDPQRARCFNKEIVMKHFDEYKAEIVDLGVKPWNIWNMDEKGLQLSGGRKNRQQKYILPSGIRNSAYTIRSDNLELVTVIECVSAAGEAMKPTFIFSGKSFSTLWFLHDNSEEVSAVAHSTNGWTDDELGHEWFEKVAIPHMKKVMKERAGSPDADEWVAMVVDGHGSHEQLQMRETAIKHKILLYSLPPHTTHKLQPLDVGVFGLLQRKWAEVCEVLARNAAIGSVLDDGEEIVGASSRGMTRNMLIPQYLKVRKEAFTESMISSAWKKTGLWPFNKDQFDEADFAPSYLSSTTTYLPPSFPSPPRCPLGSSSKSTDNQDTTVNHSIPGELAITGAPNVNPNSTGSINTFSLPPSGPSGLADAQAASPSSSAIANTTMAHNTLIGTGSFYPTPSNRQPLTAPSPTRQVYQQLPQFSIPSPLKRRAEIPTNSTPLPLNRQITPSSKAPKSRRNLVSLTHELHQANQRITSLEAQVQKSNARLERTEAHARMLAVDFSQLKDKVNSSSNSKKNKGIHFQVERRLLTSTEGLEAARKAAAEKNEAKRLEQEKRDTRKAADDERENQRILKSSSNVYSGSLKSKSKADLQDIVYSLYQIASTEERSGSKLDHREGTVAVLISRIQDYLDAHPGLSSSQQFGGLFPGSARAPRRPTVDSMEPQRPPNQLLSITQPHSDTTVTTTRPPSNMTVPTHDQPPPNLAPPPVISHASSSANPYILHNVPHLSYLYPHQFYTYPIGALPSPSMPPTK